MKILCALIVTAVVALPSYGMLSPGVAQTPGRVIPAGLASAPAPHTTTWSRLNTRTDTARGLKIFAAAVFLAIAVDRVRAGGSGGGKTRTP